MKNRIRKWISVCLCFVLCASYLCVDSWSVQAENESNETESDTDIWSDDFESEDSLDYWDMYAVYYADSDTEQATPIAKNISLGDAASYDFSAETGTYETGSGLPEGKVLRIDTSVTSDTFADATTDGTTRDNNRNMYAVDAISMIAPTIFKTSVDTFISASFDMDMDISTDPRNFIYFNYVDENNFSYFAVRNNPNKTKGQNRLQISEHTVSLGEDSVRTYVYEGKELYAFNYSNSEGDWKDPSKKAWMSATLTYNAGGQAILTLTTEGGVEISITSQNTVPESQRMVAFGASITAKGVSDNVIIDNFSMTYTKLWEYMGLLGLEEWDASQLTTLEKAATDFMQLDESAQAKLANSQEFQSFVSMLYEEENVSNGYDTYRSKWSRLLGMDQDAFTGDDRQDLESAIAEYNSADDITKMLLYHQNKSMLTAYSKLQLYRAEDDYSPFDYNFEDGMNPLEEIKGDESAVCEIVEDPTNADNQVLKLQGANSVFLTKYWPEKAQIKSIQMKVYLPDQNLFNPFYTMVSYIDDGNRECLRAYNPNPSKNRLLYAITKDYQTETKYVNGDLDLTGWLTYNIAITETGGVMFTVTDQAKKSLTLSTTFDLGGRTGFYFYDTQKNGTRLSAPAYVDDFKIEFYGKGDFDVDDDINDIIVYYSGNTFLQPNETMVLAGENLCNTVGDIHVSSLANYLTEVKKPDTMPEVVSQSSYDDDGDISQINGGKAKHQYDAENAYVSEVLQRSKSTINAVLPEDLDAGIYAVKLFALSDEADDTVIYVNRPEISFITGDEGDIATHGGQIQIVGSHLVPTGSADDVTVKLVSKDGDIYMLPVTTVYENNAYSLVVKIPEDESSLPNGNYEVYVHNGYGDNTAWSVPSKITIDASPRDAWPTTIFNVKSYGAVGDNVTNDTPAIVNALNDAAANGGGIVYFPKGVYSVVTTLAIPEKVTLLGEGETDSVIRYQAMRWQYGDVPTLISIISDVEIKDIGFQGTRFSGIVSTYKAGTARFASIEEVNAQLDEENQLDVELANIYFTNVKMRFTAFAGAPTLGGGSGGVVDGVSVDEMKLLIMKDVGSKMVWDFRGNTNNLQLNSVSLESDAIQGSGSAGNVTFRIWARQVQIRNCEWTGYSLCSTSYGAIIEDCNLTAPGLNPSGNGFYMYNNYLHDAYGNNRELLVTDGTAAQDNIKIQYIGNDPELMKKYTGEETTNECVYLAVGLNFAETSYEGYNVVVKNGQGKGQVRVVENITNVRVDGVKYTLIYVDSPFAVNPNRRSIVDIYEPRCDMFFIQNRFREGSASGTYGTMINAVWDGNLFQRHEGQYLNVNRGSIWYLTLLNQTHEEAIYMHGTGVGAEGSSSNERNDRDLCASLIATRTPYAGAIACLSIRSCDYDGYGYYIASPSNDDALEGFLMENCTFKNKSYALKVGTDSISKFSAVLFRNNNFETDEIYGGNMSGDVTVAESLINNPSVNRQGYKRIMMVETRYDSVTVVIGDVNLDGSVTLKDVTVLRFYLAGKVELNEEQEERADANQDGSISLKDVTTIRRKILGYVDKEWIGGDY